MFIGEDLSYRGDERASAKGIQVYFRTAPGPVHEYLVPNSEQDEKPR